MSGSDSDYTRNLGRNLVIGLVVGYSVTVGLCFLATGEIGQAAAIAAVPGLFAGPYLGLLITLIGAVRPRAAVQPVLAQLDPVEPRVADAA